MVDKIEPTEQVLINGQYLIFEKIGQGGFGIVWKAYDFSLRNFVAIKELLPQFANTKFIKMFYDEALIVKNLDHNNIVRVQHFWQGSNGSYYLLMDYVKGVDLDYLLRKCREKGKALPWELSVHVCGNVLKAINYINKQAKDPVTDKLFEIVYRDISPENIMVSFDGSVKLSDFGIAKTSEELNKENKQRVITGKYGYMSPEQMRGAVDIDHRSDIFSTGVVLCEMLAGEKLFLGEPDEIRAQVLESKFDANVLRERNVPDELIEVVSKSMERDKEKRYQTALEMFRDLRRLLKGKETDDLALELAEFATDVLSEEVANHHTSSEKVKDLTLQTVKNDPGAKKITCKDFIIGGLSSVSAEQEQTRYAESVAPKADGKVEEKGKTVFEEVGDWLMTSLKSYKRRLTRIALSVMISLLLFVCIDTFARITFIGRSIYTRINPPDVVVRTIPPGCKITVKTRDGKVVLEDADSARPVELRKIKPQTYVVSAVKYGFKPVQRVVKIEEQTDKSKAQVIVVSLDYSFNVNSNPPGAQMYLNGTKVGVTPWKGEISSGEHTLKLALKGFEDLGSDAKEAKDGQCNVDLSKTSDREMFAGVDQNFWTYQVSEAYGAKVYHLTGAMYRKFQIDSAPQNMVLHIEGEAKPRGVTPLRLSLKHGAYTFRFMDPEGRYQEKSMAVDAGSEKQDPAIMATLSKWVTVKVKVKDKPDQNVRAKVRIQGKSGNAGGDVSKDRPLRLALPGGIYRVTFDAGDAFKPLVLSEVNLHESSIVVGTLSELDAMLRVTVKEDATGKPIGGAFVWMNDKLLGSTDKAGLWQNRVKYGRHRIRIVAQGYAETAVERELHVGQSEELSISLKAEQSSAPVGINTVTTGLPGSTSVTPIGTVTGTASDKKSIFCPFCGKEYPLVRGRIRFCTNCGKPLNVQN